MCCCGTRMCMFCICVIAVVILIGLLFGFGVFKDAFHKAKDTVHLDPYGSHLPRPLLFAPPPF